MTAAVKENPSKSSPASAPSGLLLGQLLRFGRLLRLMGVATSLRQMLELAEALKYVSITSQRDFYWAARALLVSRREDLPIFDQAFTIFWRGRASPPSAPAAADPEKQARRPVKQARLPRADSSTATINQSAAKAEPDMAPESGQGEDSQAPITKIAFYSPIEVNREKDFREMTWEEVQAARHAMSGMEWRLGQRRTRRYRRGHRGRLHMRRVMRDNLRYGGEMLSLAYRTHALRPRPLVVLCDISGSMERYSRMLLHFIHALTHHWTGVDVEAFAFGTRLTRITHHLRHKDVDESLDELGRRVRDWSGGTRIGETVKVFNFKWARRVLGRGAVVLIISDGWDRGDARLLAREMARLQRASYRVMWLNPLVGTTGYQPTQQGMSAALPFVDDFLPGGNLASLEQLAKILSSISMQRPERRQNARVPQATELDSSALLFVSRAARKLADLPSGPAAGG